MKSPNKNRKRKKKKWPAGIKMTVRTTIREAGDNPGRIAATAEARFTQRPLRQR